MTLSISNLYTNASNLYSGVSQHVSKNKQKYSAAAIAAIAGGAYIYFNSSSPPTTLSILHLNSTSAANLNQERVQTWCKAFYFEDAHPLKATLAQTTEGVDRAFLETIKNGKIEELCMGPDPYTWDSASKMGFSDAKTNLLPDFLTFKENRLQVLKLLKEYSLIDASPGATTDYSLLHEVYDTDSLEYLLSKRTFVGNRHLINQENAQGLTPLGKIIEMRKSLKSNFDSLVGFLLKNGADVNYNSSNTQVQSPLGLALASYSKEASVLEDDANTSLLKLVNNLLANKATLKAEDFYKTSYEPGKTVLTERTGLYEALRRMSKSNPDILKTLIKNGLDLRANTPFSSTVRIPDGIAVEKAFKNPLLFQFLYHLGIDDLYFKSAEDPSQITKNLKTCLTTLTESFTNKELQKLTVYDSGSSEFLNIQDFVEHIDRTPNRTLVDFFKNRL